MAKKNVRDEPPKTQVTENAQLSDIVFILDKMELLLQAISDIDKNGRYKTVSADKKHRNSFLKISTIKIKKKWQKKLRHSNRPLRKPRSSRNTATMNP